MTAVAASHGSRDLTSKFNSAIRELASHPSFPDLPARGAVTSQRNLGRWPSLAQAGRACRGGRDRQAVTETLTQDHRDCGPGHWQLRGATGDARGIAPWYCEAGFTQASRPGARHRQLPPQPDTEFPKSDLTKFQHRTAGGMDWP